MITIEQLRAIARGRPVQKENLVPFKEVMRHFGFSGNYQGDAHRVMLENRFGCYPVKVITMPSGRKQRFYKLP